MAQQAINITRGNDHRLRVAMTRWGEPMALSSSSNVHAYAVKSLTGVRSALIVRYSSQDEGVMELDWPATLTAGCYGLEITGTLDGEGNWRMAAAHAVQVTQATEQGGESVTMTADSFDVKAVITVCEGTTGVTEELRQVIADMIEEEYNASERLREEGESIREAHEDNRILAEEAREGNEQTRQMAEVERQRNTQQAIAAANNAAAAANNAAANAKADYVGSDNYVYRWNEATQEYVKTNLYVKGADGQDGEKGDPGTTDYNDLQNKPDLSGFITADVNNLVNYYLKRETYTKQEVQGLIAAIQQFHYEIYASTSDVTSPQGNVLYLIGPTGTGADKYEEYVYDSTKQEPWVKIGDTSIDLSDYYTKGQTDNAIMSALNTALASYTTTAALTLLLAGKQDVINDLSDIRSGARAGATAYQKPQGGIPPTDMSQAVQTSLGKADSSLQPTQQTLTDAQKQQARNNIDAAGVDDVPTLPNNVSYFSGDSGDGIVPTDGIRGEDIVASSAISVHPDVVTAITGEVGSATTITLVVPNDSLRHVWDMFFTTASDGGATIVVPQGATLHVPSGYSIASGKTYEVRVIGVGNHYYLTCQEYN